MKVLEKDLQALIEQAITDGTFPSSIDSAELTAARTDRWRSAFGADFLLRRKLQSAARLILDALEGAEMVSRTPKNISLNKADRLLPDLVLVNREQARLIVVEIKRSAETARETLTELGAYEQEVRNLLPYISDLELVQVVISTDFPTLLDHGIAGMAMWTSRQILCLQVTAVDPDLRLSVHLPSAWSPIVQGVLPANAVKMHTLVLYDADEEKIDRVLPHACDLIARNADRCGAHGFLMAWRRPSSEPNALYQYFVSVGSLNPFAFLPSSVATDLIDIGTVPLGNFLLDEALDLAEASGITFEVAEPAVTVLRTVCAPAWEAETDWVSFRQPPSVVGDASYRAGCEPLRTDFWGALLDFAVERDIVPSWKDWRFGVAILDEIFGVGIVNRGRPTCGALLDLGSAFGNLSALLHGFEALDDAARASRSAPMAWAAADLSAALREIIEGSPETVRKAVPDARLRLMEPTASRTALECFVRWIADDLTGDSHPLHRIVFHAGLRAFAALERYVPASMVDPSVLTGSKAALAGDVRVLLTMLASLDQTDSLTLESREQFVTMLGVNHSASGEEVQEAIRSLDDASAVEMMISYRLPRLLDIVFAPLPLRDDALKGGVIDWPALREQVRKIAAQGSWQPVLVIHPTGDVSIGDASGSELPLPTLTDAAAEVIVVYIHAIGFEVARRERWDELSTRDVLWPFMPNGTKE